MAAVLGVGLLFLAYRSWRRRQKPDASGVEGEEAVLSYGADASEGPAPTPEEVRAANLVVRTYLELLGGLAELGMPRATSETARELASRLDVAALHGLTELFERARYGQRGLPPDATEEASRLAAATLSSVADPPQ